MFPSEYTAQDGIDDAWSQALHLDFLNHLQFGREVVFTYGPWGFISRGYSPETHGTAMLIWTVLSVTFWVAAWRLASHFSNNRAIAWAWVMAFSALATLPLGDDFNARLVAWGVLPLMLRFFVEDGKFTPLQGAIAVAWGLLSLTKFTGTIEAIAIFSILSLDDLRQRKFPWGLVLLTASMLLFWVLAHQQLSSIIPYVINSLRITSGYSDAMMTLHRPGETTQILCFMTLAGALLMLAGIISWRQLKYTSALVVIALSAILFLIFKGGLVRMDTMHEVSASMGILLIALAVMSIAWRNQPRVVRLSSVLLVLAGVFWATNLFNRSFHELTLVKQALDTLSPRALIAPFQAAFTDSLVQKDIASRQLYKAHYPLPLLSGGSDLYTMDLNVLFAHGLKYNPRPVPHSYSAYSAELSELNAAFLRSPAAPANLFFNLCTIDSRYPSLDDSRSWPTLLTSYDVKGMSSSHGQFLVMQRARNPRSYSLEAISTSLSRFGQSTSVPDASNGPIWVEVDFAKSAYGRLQTLLYKPQGLTMTIATRDNGRRIFRMIPGMAHGGFLLSPCISNTDSFAWFACTGGRSAPDEMNVTAITFETDSEPNTCYRSEIAIRFYRLQFQPQNVLAEPYQTAN